VKGVVLAQRQLGEQDRFIDILTDNCGVLEVLVKGAGKINSKSGSGAQLFAYSDFCLRPLKNGYALSSVSPIRIFYKLRSSVSAVALASYFSQVILFSVLPQASTPEIQQLFLNCLYFLSEGTCPERTLKAVFELRMCALLGFMPDVVMCRGCGAYLPESLFFSVENGTFCCKECTSRENSPGIEMTAGTLCAIRHIVLREPERIFSFRLSARCLPSLYAFAEQFLQYHIDSRFTALEYYNVITGESPVT
jgi:DNA repair protein RecO (recombination protein O)